MADKPKLTDECFIVGVIGKPGSEQRIHADWFIDGIVEPVFAESFSTIKVLRADRMNTPGMITTQIIQKLMEAKLVIADLTYLNPNAFYEIGIRHMANLPIIHVHHEGEIIPFDVGNFMSMEYALDEHHQMLAARNSLRTLVANVLQPDHKVDNPVTQARGRAKFDETATPADQILEREVASLTSRLGSMERMLKGTSLTPSRAATERASLGQAYPRVPKIVKDYKAPYDNIYMFSVRDPEGEPMLHDFMTRFVAIHSEDRSALARIDDGVYLFSTSDVIPEEVVDRWLELARPLKINVMPVGRIARK